MIEKAQNDMKDTFTNSINNYSSDLSKNPLPVSNIKTNINSISFSQEYLFNELINSTNYHESKNNSSFYNFSESVHSIQDSPNIIMNKEQLYQAFLLFQKFLNQNIVNSNTNNNLNSNNISSIKIENPIKNKSNYKLNNKVNNVIDEINELEDNNDKNIENKDQSNGIIISERNMISQDWTNNQIKNNNKENQNKNELNEKNNNFNLINGIDINNGGNNNLIIVDENKDNDIKLMHKDKNLKLQLNNNISFQQRNNIDDIKNNNETKNSYDDIPIKYNKVKFIDLVEKKLADEKKNKIIGINNIEKDNILEDEKIKEKLENNNISYCKKKIKNKLNKDNIDKEKKIGRIERDKNKIISQNNKSNILSNNYSFDRDEIKILNKKNNISENNVINNFNNILNMSDKKQNNIDNINFLISKEKKNLLKLYLIENAIKEYKIDKIQFSLINNSIKFKKKEETENNEINKIEEKKELLNQKIKELNKGMVRLKEERNKVSKIKIKYEKSMLKLNNDLYQFIQRRDEFEKYRKNELNKIKNDKKNIIIETKNIKEIKNQNQALIIKSKKDKEIIDDLKAKISELQSIIRQKENNFNTNTFKFIKKKNGNNKANILAELDIDCINTNQIIDDYLGTMRNNSIRSMTNINNIFCNTIEDKIKNRINKNDIEKEKKIQNISLTLKRNNSTNKNYEAISKRFEILIKGNKHINNNSSSINNLNLINGNKNTKNIGIINNKSVENNSVSKKLSEKTQKKMIGNEENLNEQLIFSPQPSRTSIGFGLKKLSAKLNNTPKETIKITKKIFENKNCINKKIGYSKTTTNNLTNSFNNKMKNDSNQNSYSSNINNNKNILNINNKKSDKEKLMKKQNLYPELFNSNIISKKIVKKQKKKEKKDIFSSKSKNNLLNKALKINKGNEKEESNSLSNSQKIKNLNNKVIGKDIISRNLNIKTPDKINITDKNVINIKNKNYLNQKIKNNEISEEYNFTIPKKYLNTNYKLIKSLKTEDKIINLYTYDKKEIIFKSGVRKEIYQDGHQLIYFVNGDLKQIYPDGKSSYFFQESKTVQITLNNGIEIYKFENGQVEKHYPDGTKQILFNDGSERYIYNDGYEETFFSDGNVQKIDTKRNIIDKQF